MANHYSAAEFIKTAYSIMGQLADAVIKEIDFKQLLQLTDQYSNKRIDITDNVINKLSNRRMIGEYVNLYQRLLHDKELKI